MVAYSAAVVISLVGYALGTLGGGLVFIELFQLPSYVSYDESFGSYNIKISPKDARQYTWAGRVGALLIALAFALQFVSALV
jgi:hypothetical protein